MTRVGLVTDSSALLSASAAARIGVEVVPVAVALDGAPFDELTSSLDWFYERLRAGATATTSQPSPGELALAYERAADRGAQSIVSIHLDARASGVVPTAELVARDAPVPVTVVDTRTVSFGVGLCVRAAAEALARRGLAGDAVRAASRLGAALRNAFVAPAGAGGRVPESEAWTVFRYADGGAVRMSQQDSIEDAVRALGEEAFLRGGEIAAAVGHAGREAEAAADTVERLLRARGTAVVERYRVGASVGAHTGPDCFGLFWWPAATRP